ncbi:unnamed protein product, partial [Ixodes persulcatus]
PALKRRPAHVPLGRRRKLTALLTTIFFIRPQKRMQSPTASRSTVSRLCCRYSLQRFRSRLCRWLVYPSLFSWQVALLDLTCSNVVATTAWSCWRHLRSLQTLGWQCPTRSLNAWFHPLHALLVRSPPCSVASITFQSSGGNSKRRRRTVVSCPAAPRTL